MCLLKQLTIDYLQFYPLKYVLTARIITVNATKIYVNVTKLKRAENCYSNVLKSSSATLIKPQAGRPSTNASSNGLNENEDNETLPNKTLRSSVILFKSNACIICQNSQWKLRTVTLMQTGINTLEVAKKDG